MHIVRRAAEDKIDKAAKLAGENARKLADTITEVLALRREDKLTVETIEEALELVEGEKKPTDLISSRPMGGTKPCKIFGSPTTWSIYGERESVSFPWKKKNGRRWFVIPSSACYDMHWKTPRHHVKEKAFDRRWRASHYLSAEAYASMADRAFGSHVFKGRSQAFKSRETIRFVHGRMSRRRSVLVRNR